MPDIISLLPDSVASQIAAGEVIQRPASALKEMLDNSIDAGATQVTVVLKDAGKMLIQVIDDGCGMSENDARMCFERHATSKIRQADDLYSIRTMGFRGEALAAIAAIAQVELKTRRHEDATGIRLEIEGSEFKLSEPCSCPAGTNLSVKNLFFNTPARRNFLKSNASETRHLIEEFQRCALAHPSVSFRFFHDGNEIFHLRSGNLRQRIAAIFGAAYNERLVPVEEETSLMRISGFIIKPEFSKKTRGEQFFFVNQRFIKDAYLHHAVNSAFDELLPKDSYPSYFLFIETDPSKIDVNIHPTKTEIKFEDERMVYSVMKASVKRALGKFSIAPSLDFEQEPAFILPPSKFSEAPKIPSVKINPGYNPFAGEKNFSQNKPSIPSNWRELYAAIDRQHEPEKAVLDFPSKLNSDSDIADLPDSCFRQVGSRFLAVIKPQEILLVEKLAAAEKIIYEKFKMAAAGNVSSQQDLFPQTFEFSATDFSILEEIKPALFKAGFDLHEFGRNSVVVHGIPSMTDRSQMRPLLEELLEKYKNNPSIFRSDPGEHIALSLARNHTRMMKETLSHQEIKQLVTDLLQCETPEYGLYGKRILVNLDSSKISKLFES